MDKAKKSSCGRCIVCGRILRKSVGPIGPVCLKKIRGNNRNSRRIRMKKSSYICISAKYDIYKKEDLSGSGKDDSSSKNTEG